MRKKRVYEVAKEFKMTSKILIDKLKSLNIEVTNHMSTLDENQYHKFVQYVNPEKDEKPKKKKTITKEKKKKKKVQDIEDSQKNKKLKTYQKKQVGSRAKYKKKKEVEKVEEGSVFHIYEVITLHELADLLKLENNELIMKFFNMGEMYNVNSNIDFETAYLLASEMGVELKLKKNVEEIQNLEYDYEDKEKDLIKRAPVVTVMGHVDHGKTSILDAIRKTNVTEREAGGITQHIGASEIKYNNKKIVFLDTPGHEAFTTLRARGAQITDIAVLVVAADDGVKPQTVEAISHAKNAEVPILVVINKIDKPDINIDRVKQELSERGILVEDWGGEVVCVEASAKTGENIESVLEMILLIAEMQELKANPNRLGVGTVIEANVDKRMGIVATILVEKGTMNIGDPIFAGASFGRVRTMINDKGKRVKKCGPSSAFKMTGLNNVPQAGDKIYVTESDQDARIQAEKNALEDRKTKISSTRKVATLENIFENAKDSNVKELNIILRADVHGSIEAIKGSLEKIKNEEVKINIIKDQVGAITESDILLASASKAVIIGFNVRPSNSIVNLSERENIEIRTYRIIYELINDIRDALAGLLDPEQREVVEGSILVRELFKVASIGTIAGGYVQNGKISRKSHVRLIRDGVVIYEGKVSSLKRFKNDVSEVKVGYECGIGLEKYNDLKENDIIETFLIKEIKRELND